jgi:phosphate transport system substrate-binding protein
MTPTRWSIVWGMLLGASAGCQPASQDVRNLVLTGSPGMTPVMHDIAKRFEAGHPGVRVDVQGRGSSQGVTDVRQGLADIGMLWRDLKPEETNLYATAIARDGVCLVVHKDNPVTTLTDDQVVQIYTRIVSNWKTVGGVDAPIVLVQMAEGYALLEMFLDHFKLKSTQIRADITVPSSELGIDAVVSRPPAIAYVSCAYAETGGAGKPFRSLVFGGVAPSMATVRDGSYPLSRPLNLVTREVPRGVTKEFIDFARSPAVGELIDKYHFVPLTQ